jgi:uncharacterized protein YkwD
MKNKILLTTLALSLILQASCQTPEEKETVVDKPVVIQEPKAIDPPKEEVDLTAASSWSPNLYERHSEQSFQNIEKINSRIDFSKIDYPLLNASIFYETNRRRIEMSLPPLKYSPALEKAATQHSMDMVKLDFYSHTSPVAGRETPKKRLELYGISNAYTAENINIGFGIAYEGGRPVYTPGQNNGNFFSYSLNGIPLPPQTYRSLAVALVDSWMNSPGHRRNILNTNLIFLGIGTYHYKDAKFFGMDKFKATQKFSSISGKLPGNN